MRGEDSHRRFSSTIIRGGRASEAKAFISLQKGEDVGDDW